MVDTFMFASLLVNFLNHFGNHTRNHFGSNFGNLFCTSQRRVQEAFGGARSWSARCEYRWRRRRRCTGTHFFAGSPYHEVGVLSPFFTPLFENASTACWCAHFSDQFGETGYNGPPQQPFLQIAVTSWSILEAGYRNFLGVLKFLF